VQQYPDHIVDVPVSYQTLQGLSYLVVIGIIGWSAATKASTGRCVVGQRPSYTNAQLQDWFQMRRGGNTLLRGR
jgi:hypothetical protein